MARPQKNNADYFSHDNDMRNDDKIKAVRRRFKHEGFSVWIMMLEKLCKADGFTLEYSDLNIELWAGDFEIETEKLKEIIQFFIKMELLTTLDSLIFSETMISRFNGLLAKRNTSKERFQKQKLEESGVSATESTQSKVKESKVKNVSINLFEECQSFVSIYGQEMINKFLNYWQEKDKKGKERWMKEKTWETKRRLNTWSDNDKNFNKPSQQTSPTKKPAFIV